MQYHLNGYRTGDPSVLPEVSEQGQHQDNNRDKVDVLIVGCGPAGLTLAAQLSAFANISTRIVERKDGPLEVGQADGVACRSMEMFEAFGFADQVKKEAYHVNEVTFWRPATDGSASLIRADRIQDVEDGLSEMPHTILNQARVHDFYLDFMRRSSRRLTPDYGMTLTGLQRDDTSEHPVTATFQLADQTETNIHAKFIVGCDGARSTVRESLGLELKGESARQLWGVMDVLPVTDFPDIRLKTAIQSANDGSLLIIPREGGYMARLYIELDVLRGSERASERRVTSEQLINKARDILSPYTLDVKEVVWWSAYEIGQRVCDIFDDTNNQADNYTPRVFIAGDACHTHSPKAGQGMNVSMADSFNLGWKLAAVLRGQAGAALLRTYSEERQAKAQELIDFDRDIARLFSAKPETPKEAAQFQQYFKKHGRYTAGVETRYDPSLITDARKHQALATGYPVGKRFHSAPVIRMADALPMELGHVLKADGRWRLIALAPKDDNATHACSVASLCDYLQNAVDSPVRRYTPAGADIDTVIDVRAVFQQPHREVEINALPSLLLPAKGRYGLIDYEKIFCINPANDIFDLRGIDRTTGVLIVIRPDQFVASVLPLDAHDLLSQFFARFMLPQQPSDREQ